MFICSSFICLYVYHYCCCLPKHARPNRSGWADSPVVAGSRTLSHATTWGPDTLRPIVFIIIMMIIIVIVIVVIVIVIIAVSIIIIIIVVVIVVRITAPNLPTKIIPTKIA